MAVPRWSSYRNALAGWGFFACFCAYLMRINFSVAIVCMTYEPGNSLSNTTFLSENCDNGTLGCEEYSNGTWSWATKNREFGWNRQLRGTLNSSFFWGYIITQMMGGWLAQKFGGKLVIASGMLLSIVTSLLCPPAARYSPYALLTMRFINGLGQSVLFPALYGMSGNWFPLVERALLLAMYGAGATFGGFVGFAVSGYLCANSRWEWIFWTYGIVSIVWLSCWLGLVYDTPRQHPRISVVERDFIEKSLHSTGTKPRIPWLALLTDSAVWSLVVVDFCNWWVFIVTITQLPEYMRDVLKVSIATNGVLNSLPKLLKCLFSFLFSLAGDYILKTKRMKVTPLRKVMSSICTLLPMICVIPMGYLDANTVELAIVLLILQELFNSAQRAGFSTSRVDIAPKFSGILCGIFNTSGNLPGILAPLVISQITADGTQAQWRLCFYMSAVMYFIAWLSFMIFGTSDEREWAKGKEIKETETEDLIIGQTSPETRL